MEAENKKVLGKKPIIIGAVSALAVIIAVVVIVLINLNSITAIDIRLRRLVGTVNLFDGKGKEKSIVENMRLNSGHGLKTAEESLVMLSLDDTKLLTLEEASKAKIKAKGKKLEFALESGSLFFNVNQKLENDESFDIRTSTMVCGIRGTSAFIGKDAYGHETVMVTDGTVHVIAENPKTHEITEIDVSAGEMITIYLDEEAEGDATISIKKTRFREEDLPALALDAIQKDLALTERIAKATGFSKDKIYMLHEATSSSGVSMYGEAANELVEAGIADAIPFQGSKSRIMISAANSAADVAGESLPLESSVVNGVRSTVDAGSNAGYKESELETLAKSATDNTVKVILEAKDAGLKDDDLVKVADSVGNTITETVSMMGSGNYNPEHVNNAVEAIGTVMTGAISEAASEGGTSDVLNAVKNEADRVNETVVAEVNKKASGEETVASILNELENRAVVSNEPNGDKNDTPASTDDKPSEDKKETDTSGTTSGNTTGRRTTNTAAGNTAQTGNTGNDNQSGSSSSSQTVAVSGVSLNISSFNMDVSDTVTITATISPSNATNTGITWSSSDDTVASVSGSGLTATVTGVSDGTATITATTADGGKTASFTATVQSGLVKYLINASSVTNGTISSSVTESAAGNPVALTVTPADHYHVDNVFANGVNSSLTLTQSGNTYTFTMPAEDVSVGATFAGDTYTLTLNVEGGTFTGAAIPTGYVYGTGATLPSNGTKQETAQISYAFDGWYTERTGGTRVDSISATDYGNKVLYARFTESPRQYGVTVSVGNLNNGTVTVTDADGNSLTQAGSTAGYGTVVTVTATPSANCSLDSLQVTALDSSAASVSVTVSNNTATFTMPADAVSVSVNADFIKNVTGVTLDNTTKSVGVGQNATLTATVAPSDAADTSVTWSVSPEGIVTVTPGTGASANTATITGVSLGSATVTVTTTDGSKTATCAVTVSDGTVASGTINNVSWEIYDRDESNGNTTRVLEFTGSGQITSNPWTDVDGTNYRDTIQEILIGEGITAISDYIFKDSAELVTVQLPSTITTLADGVFRNSPNLITINLGNITAIGSTSTNRKDYVEAHGTFSNCTSLASVDLSNVKTVGAGAFYQCTALTQAIMPNGENFGIYAFKGCSSLTTVEIGKFKSFTRTQDSSDQYACSYAFYYCQALTTVTITGSGNTNKAIIGNTFMYCNSLNKVVLSDDIHAIYNNAFSKCKNLSIYIPEGCELYQGAFGGVWNGTSSSAITDSEYVNTIYLKGTGPTILSSYDGVFGGFQDGQVKIYYLNAYASSYSGINWNSKFEVHAVDAFAEP